VSLPLDDFHSVISVDRIYYVTYYSRRDAQDRTTATAVLPLCGSTL